MHPSAPGRGPSGSWAAGEGPVYRRLARALEAVIDRGGARAGDAPALRADPFGGARALEDHGRVGLRGAPRGRSRREPPAAGRACAGPPSRGPGLRLREDPSGSFRRHPVYRSLVDGPGRHDRVPRGPPAGARDALPRELARVDERLLRELARGPGYLPMGRPSLRQCDRLGTSRAGACSHSRGAGDGDPRRAAGDRPRGGAVPRARRRRPRRGPTLPRLDRSLTGLGARLVPIPVGRRRGLVVARVSRARCALESVSG